MRAVLVAFLMLALAQPVCAAPSVVQTASGGGASGSVTAVLAAAPNNGDILVSLVNSNALGGGAPSSVQDSNSIAFAKQATGTTGGAEASLAYDEVSLNDPTATVTCVSAGAASCTKFAVLDLSAAAYPGVYNSASGTATSPTVTISGIASGWIIACGVTTTAGTAETIAISNSSGLTSIYAASGRSVSYATATSTTAVCTGGTSATWGIAIAAYGPVSTGVIPPCAPTLYPCPKKTIGFLDLGGELN